MLKNGTKNVERRKRGGDSILNNIKVLHATRLPLNHVLGTHETSQINSQGLEDRFAWREGMCSRRGTARCQNTDYLDLATEDDLREGFGLAGV